MYKKGIIIMGEQQNPLESEQTIFEVDEVTVDEYNVVVYNDDFNTFEHVIETLKRACKHTQEQAEQCTYLIHFKGKCAVKSGERNKLTPIKDAICDAGIDARIL
jgi:ATP-dependent Clp protease adaptor protein ClpS